MKKRDWKDYMLATVFLTQGIYYIVKIYEDYKEWKEYGKSIEESLADHSNRLTELEKNNEEYDNEIKNCREKMDEHWKNIDFYTDRIKNNLKEFDEMLDKK